MSVRAMTWAWSQDLKTGEKLLLLALADHAGHDGVCWPGQRKLAEKCGISDRQVRRLLPNLEALGLIEREQRRRGDGFKSSDLIVLKISPDNLSGDISGDLTGHFGSRVKEPSENRQGGDRAHARPKIGGKVVNLDSWLLTQAILEEFNRQTRRDLRLLTSSGQPSEAAKRIYGRVRAYPDITLEQHGRIIAATLASRWWGSDKPSVGVVYGPKVFEDNIARRPTASNPGQMGGSGPPSAEWLDQLNAKLERDRAQQ